jgi:hypothetical protein
MATTSAVLAFAACAVLLWSGLEKLRNRAPLAQTVSALTGSPTFASRVAITVPSFELATVGVVVLGAPAYLASAMFVALGVTFATAGAWAWRTGRVIPCACFGSTAGRLGVRQVGAMPLWLLAAWATLHLGSFAVHERLAALTWGIVGLGAARAIPAMRGLIAARHDRRALAGGK